MNRTQIAMAAQYVTETSPLEHLQDIGGATEMIREWVRSLEGMDEGYISSASYVLHKETLDDGSAEWSFDHKVFSFYDSGDYFDWQS